MANLIHIIKRKHPKSEKEQYYYSRINAGLAETKDLAKLIAVRAGQSVGSVIGILDDMHDIVGRYLAMGYSVDLKPLGILSTELHTKGEDKKEDAIKKAVDNIRKVNIHFLPSTEFKGQFNMKNIKFVDAAAKFRELEHESPLP